MLIAACAPESTGLRPVASVTVSPAPVALEVGQTVTLTARAVDGSGSVITDRPAAWSSSDSAVATVAPTGVVTAAGPGTAQIRATVEGKAGVVSLTVRPASVAQVNVSPAALTLEEGAAHVLAARAYDARGVELAGREVQWESEDPTVAEVAAAGRIVGKRHGVVRIVARVEGVSASVIVTVTRPAVARIVVTPAGFVLDVGRTRQLTALLFDAQGNQLAGRAVAWITDSPAVAGVGAGTGLVTGFGPGYATITAISEGRTFSLAVTVSNGEDDAMPYDLLYHRTTPSALGEVMILGTAGSGPPFRVNAGNVSREPAARPDGGRIAFYVSQVDLTGEQVDDIFAVDRNGMNMKRLTSEPGYDGEPAWSPDGSRIAYRRIDPVSQRASIWAMAADGSAKVNLTADLPEGERPGGPAWSPDGSRIAFASNATSGGIVYASAIWVMNADGSGKQRIVSGAAGSDRNPTWHPDGERIAFTRVYNGDADVAIVSATGGAVTRIALPGGQDSPAWSSDGRHIAFSQVIDATVASGIYTMRADGTNVRLHTLDPAWGGGYRPRWIRRP